MPLLIFSLAAISAFLTMPSITHSFWQKVQTTFPLALSGIFRGEPQRAHLKALAVIVLAAGIGIDAASLIELPQPSQNLAPTFKFFPHAEQNIKQSPFYFSPLLRLSSFL
jgi:hypothetical protein